ncbi:hypothetical protein H257_17317 [Aphanomyces astaci]|uniref:Uncharacterized protein n=1 Tax=Aphanomyces astaci TaxID=112090 RepID=W4FFE8_APHAT|nr:hypothetical protein H257_17317 [Aphanomyces astaci]ETV66165.1 hypothetical protein H257_17317 [Aphanomyces astaci]|eukprot:XP_009844354.1 hypothetical protein H257_17317 [Aphanomyces astaci]
MRNLLASSSDLYFSASCTMRSMSSLLKRPLSFVIVILFSLPVDFSIADTFKIPFASMSNVTSTCGTPRGMGGIPSNQRKLAQQVVVARHRALAFKHLDQHTRLVVRVRRKRLRLLRRHRRVALDQRRHHTAGRFQPERQRRHVQQQQVLQLLRAVVARQDRGLHGRAERHGFVGVDRLTRLLAVEEVRQQLLHLGDTGRPAHKHHFVHLALGQLRVAQHLLHRLHRLAEVVTAHVFETRAGDRAVEINAVEQRVDFNVRLCRRRQRALGALAGRAQTAEGTLVRGHVLAVLTLELSREVVHQTVVEIFTTQVRVTGSCLHFKDAFFDRQQRHIKGPAAQVENQHVAFATLLVQTVRDGGGRGFVDDTQHVQASNGTGVLGRLALRVVKVRRHRDDGVVHRGTDKRFRHFLHLDQHHRRDFFGLERLGFALELDRDLRLVAGTWRHLERPVLDVGLDHRVVELAADQTLGVEHRVGRVHRHLVLGGVTDQALAVRECHVRRGRAVTLVVGNDFHAVILPYTHAGIGRAEIDTDTCALDCSHDCLFTQIK